MNEMIFRALFRGLKNTPTAGNVERLHEEYMLNYRSHLRTASLTETLTLAGGSVNFTNQLPAGARVLFGSMRLIGAMALTTAVKLGLGTAGSPSAFALSTATMADTTTTDNATPDAAAARTTALTTAVLSAVDTSGAAAGTGAGVVECRIVYQYVQPLFN